jgi:hypothetical protein
MNQNAKGPNEVSLKSMFTAINNFGAIENKNRHPSNGHHRTRHSQEEALVARRDAFFKQTFGMSCCY